jgi:ribulose 1,5-bisphosphate synthetase/thiazole synthase
MTTDTTNGTKNQEQTDVVIVGRGFGRLISDYHLAASEAVRLLPFVGAR